jgi:iron-sulfur cluster assembly accessory protein
MADFPISLTEIAANKAWQLLNSQGREDMRLRIAVQAGGCAGLQYQLFFDERGFDGDVVEQFGEIEVVVDKASVPYLQGAIIDYHDSIEKQGFDIDNPNATGSCACGDSFH